MVLLCACVPIRTGKHQEQLVVSINVSVVPNIPPPPEIQSPCPCEGSSGFFLAAFCHFGWEVLGAGWGQSSRFRPGGLCLYHFWEPVSLWLWVFSINICNPF